MKESKVKIRERAVEITRLLYQAYPDSHCSLNYKNAHELLVATILSAQCTDHRVNIVTKDLFLKYQSPQDFAYCDLQQLSRNIHSCGYHNQKAKSIQGASLKIVEEHGSMVPDNMNDLTELPGVGRKTANCILGEIYDIPVMVIDTHMIRIMGLLGFTNNKDPKKIEKDLMELFDEKDWVKLTHMVIDHGRSVCIARRPRCNECALSDLCPSADV